MIDLAKLEPVLGGYQTYFPKHWPHVEDFKWEAAQHFHDHWNIDAADFGEMFKEATAKVFSLLDTGYAYPRAMILNFAAADCEATRAMFRSLFDESTELSQRIIAFQAATEEIRTKYNDGSWNNHYQNTSAISVYLWLRYPDQYYIYRYSVARDISDAKAGDLVIGYEANPVKRVVALAKITQESNGKEIYFEKTESLTSPIDYAVLKAFPELEKMEFFVQPNGSLFKLSEGEYNFILDLIRDENPAPVRQASADSYTRVDFLHDVFLSEQRYEVLVSLLRHKKNIILQGAPGVGKTYAAKRLAYSIMGQADSSRVEFVQFHQNYSYEDIMLGYRPDGSGFKLTEGVFYRFCQKASNDPDREYFFLIDEINRGNLSKIFGELMMLIESDHRGEKITLAYNGMSFYVPENLYIIGMMNTADRSLAMIDYALRRRFSFFEIEPAFTSDGFQKYQSALDNETFNALVEQIKALNREITTDASLGPGFRVGHSYFCLADPAACTTDWMRSVVEFDLLPTLAEYWFDAPDKLHRWEKNLRGVFNDD